MRNDDDPSKPSKREDVLKMNADSDGNNGDDAGEAGRNLIAGLQRNRNGHALKSYFVKQNASVMPSVSTLNPSERK